MFLTTTDSTKIAEWTNSIFNDENGYFDDRRIVFKTTSNCNSKPCIKTMEDLIIQLES